MIWIENIVFHVDLDESLTATSSHEKQRNKA